ncbi:hypothetical protein [Flavisericum labens]|uniref:hypothetical protein n=1 Tax=Flavisericum labens TaxID=3377112 RepID=UPI00387B1F13
MRTLILSIVCVFTLNGITAQENDLALLDYNSIETKSIEQHVNYTTSATPNFTYLRALPSNQSSNIVEEWRERLANYNLKNTSVFDDSEKATYRVAFKNKQVHIVADYDSNRKILSTKETYKNINIPLILRVKIAKAYPGWSFSKSTFHLNYSYKEGIYYQYYRIQISNGKEKKILKVNKDFYTI